MKRNNDFARAICGFGFGGAAAVSLLFLTWTGLFQPRLLGDGQYGMVFLLTSPLGWFAGSVLGLVRAMADKRNTRPRHPLWAGIGMVAGGVIAIPLPGMFFMMIFCSFAGWIAAWVKG